MAASRDDLCFAALVFLQGSESPTGGRQVQVGISPEAVTRVADTLMGSEAHAISVLVGAVARYRRDGSWPNREAVIEAVTVAVVPVAGR